MVVSWAELAAVPAAQHQGVIRARREQHAGEVIVVPLGVLLPFKGVERHVAQHLSHALLKPRRLKHAF